MPPVLRSHATRLLLHLVSLRRPDAAGVQPDGVEDDWEVRETAPRGQSAREEVVVVAPAVFRPEGTELVDEFASHQGQR